MNLNDYLSLPGQVSKSLAKSLGVPPPLLCQWRTGVRRVPAGRCPTIERITGGVVTCEEMRPDVDWAYIRKSPADHKEEAA